MTDTAFRSLFKNDTVMARTLDGDHDHDDDDHEHDDDDNGHVVYAESPHAGGGGGGSYNTGPKGVARDARAYRAHATARQQTQVRAQAQALAAASLGVQTYADEEASDRLREAWVEKNMKALSKARKIERCTASQYLDIVESMAAVLVVLTTDQEDDGEADSVEMVKHMTGLLHKYGGVKMIQLDCEEAGIDHVACPAVLLYEQGNLTVNAMRVVDELQAGEELGQRAIEDVLLKLGALKQEFRMDLA